MADISIKATLTGAVEAQRGLDALNTSTKDLNKTFESESTVLTELARRAQEHRDKMAEQDAATQRLSAHTEDLARAHKEADVSTQAQNTSLSKGIGVISEFSTGLIGGAVGVFGFGEAIKEVISAGTEFDLSQVRLAATLKSTGSVAGFTQNQLNEMADAMAKGHFDSGALTQAQTVLMNFSNVSGEVFERTLSLSKDLAEKMGIALPQAARLLGRAVQEPAEGLNVLNRQFGGLSPQIEATIKKLDAMGDSAGARAMMLDQFEAKIKGFSDQVGESAPAAIDRFKTAWHNLFEEIGKGVSTPIGKGFDILTRSLDGWTGAISRLKENDLKAQMRDIVDELSRIDPASNKAKELNKRMQQLQKEFNDAEDKEMAAQAAARAAADSKALEEKAAKEKAYQEKQLKENEEFIKKIDAEQTAADRHDIEMMDIKAKTGQMTLQEEADSLDRLIKLQNYGTQSWIAFTNARIRVGKEMSSEEDKATSRILDNYDLEIKAGKQTYDAKISYIDTALKKDELSDDQRTKLLKERQKTEQEYVAEAIRMEDDRVKALTKTQNSYEKLAEVDIGKIRHTVYPDSDAEIAALENLGKVYANLGEEGQKAYEKIQKAIANTETVAEKQGKRLQSTLGEASFDVIGTLGRMQSSWQSTFGDMLHGTVSFFGTLKSLWKGAVDAVISEIARLLARWLLAQAVMASSSGGLFGSMGGVLGGFGQIADGGSGGNPFASIVGKLFGGALGGGAAAYSQAAIGTVFLAQGGDHVVTSPTDFLVGEGGVASSRAARGPGFQMGGSGIFTRPTVFRAGEGGPERVSVRPMAGGAGSSGDSGMKLVFQGPNILDQFTMKRFIRDIDRQLSKQHR